MAYVLVILSAGVGLYLVKRQTAVKTLANLNNALAALNKQMWDGDEKGTIENGSYNY